MHDLLCKLKFDIENRKFLGKFVLIFFKSLFLIIFLFEAGNTCFLLISGKFAAGLRKTRGSS